jgi:hypothetical protein
VTNTFEGGIDMVSITEEVKIVAIITDKAPSWTIGLIGSFNPAMYIVDLCDPRNGHHQVFPAEAFTFTPAHANDKPHVLRILEAQRAWQHDELAMPDWQLQEALMFPNKDPRKA